MRKRDRDLIALSKRLGTLGISLTDQDGLRRIEMTLHRWAEAECNGEIQRDGDDEEGAPRRYYQSALMPGGFDGKGYRIADKERGALKRLAAIMARYPYLWAYHQRDPRGCALYVGRYLDLPNGTNISKPEHVLESYYTRGVAVCL